MQRALLEIGFVLEPLLENNPQLGIVESVRAVVARKLEAGLTADSIIGNATAASGKTWDAAAMLEAIVAHWMAAEQKFTTGGIDAAWPSLLRAHRLIGSVEHMLRLTWRSHAEVSARGGVGHGANATMGKMAAAKLLRSMKPEGGWPDAVKARKAIFSALDKACEGNDVAKDLAGALITWFSKDTVHVMPAFKETRRQST